MSDGKLRYGAYEKYLALNKALIALMAQDVDDTPEGDELRDLMDLAWERMTEEERDLANEPIDRMMAEVGVTLGGGVDDVREE